jgi:hypothetical protein
MKMMTTPAQYKAKDKELAFMLYHGLSISTYILPEKLDEILEANRLNWCHDNAAAFELMCKYACYPSSHELSDSVLVDEELEYIENHQDKETAVRFAIVNAVITKLKKRKPM